MFSPTPEQQVDILQRYDDGYPIRAIATHYRLDIKGPDYDVIFNMVHRRRRWKTLEDPPTWKPTCISEQEYEDWKTLMQTMSRPFHPPAIRPCDDCWPLWALARREEGRCNGSLTEERIRAKATA